MKYSYHLKYIIEMLHSINFYSFPEMDGTSAENFTCVLYNVSSVNCTWNAGRNAPEDVQYFLYLKKYREQKRECPHYINNTLGRHITCHIPKMTFGKNEDIYYIVNGSSKKSQIQFYDVLLKLCSHGKKEPVKGFVLVFKRNRNLTVLMGGPLLRPLASEPDSTKVYDL